MDCPLLVGNKSFPQVKEFKYLGDLFTNEGTMEQETGAVRAVVTKRALSQKAKLLIYWSVFIPSLTYGLEGWVMTDKTRSWIQAAVMGFLRVASVFLREKVRSSVNP